MRQAAPTTADILIVGAGPTGLLLANLLGTMGVRTLLVERNTATVQAPRAVSIDDESFRALQAIGLDGIMKTITSRGYGSLYRGPKGKIFATVMPWRRDYGFEKRNAFQQPELEGVMRDALDRYTTVDLQFCTELLLATQTDDAVQAQMKGPDGEVYGVEARYLVACDGGRSGVRRSLGITMEGYTFEEPWLIVDLHSTQNRCFHTEVFCNPARSCITLPGPGGIRRYEFKLNPGETVEQAEKEAFARNLLKSVGPDENEPLRRVQVYSFHARSAARWREKRMLLAGDAAHLTPPFAGQGMNSGLRDAHNLAWKLDEALRADDPEPFLASYETERKPHAWQMIELARRMGQVMMPTSPLMGAAIRGGFHLMGLFPPAKAYFAQMKYKPKPQFTEGLLWRNGLPAKKTIVGRMIPQPMIETVERKRVLLDTILPDTPIILIYAERPDEVVTSDEVLRLRAVGATVIGLTPERTNPVQTSFPVVRDHGRLFMQAPYISYLGMALLLRRDRYIAAACNACDVMSLEALVRKIHVPAAAARDGILTSQVNKNRTPAAKLLVGSVVPNDNASAARRRHSGRRQMKFEPLRVP